MDYVPFYTPAEMKEAEMKEGDIIVANSPHPSEEMECDGENEVTNNLGEEEMFPSATSFLEHSEYLLSTERRKRSHDDMLEQEEDPSSLT
jgi:hypothetical protein